MGSLVVVKAHAISLATVVVVVALTLVTSSMCPCQEVARNQRRMQLIEKYTKDVPEAAERSYPDLAAYLAKPARDDLEKAWAFFSYTVSHLRMPQEGEKWSSEPLELLGKTRVASCAGFAEVFRGLCLAGGLKAVYIRGWVRKGRRWTGGTILLEETNHSWT